MEEITNTIITWFKDQSVAATSLTLASFLLGVIITTVIAFLFKGKCACKHKKYEKSRKPFAKSRRDDTPALMKRHPAPADGSIEIYVGNLSYDLTEERLREEFEAFGKVNSARIITNRYNGKSKGFGFVHMPNRNEVEAALKGLNDKEILGRAIKCNEAKNVG